MLLTIIFSPLDFYIVALPEEDPAWSKRLRSGHPPSAVLVSGIFHLQELNFFVHTWTLPLFSHSGKIFFLYLTYLCFHPSDSIEPNANKITDLNAGLKS